MAAPSTQRELIVAAFHSHAEAQQAVRDLKAAGFADDHIGVASQDSEGRFQEHDEGTKAGEGAAAGAAVGLGAGALWGLGIVAGALPAIGPVIAGGALAAIAASAAGTAAAGGVIGALIGLGIPEHEAEYYHGELERGRTIVTVRATGDDAVRARRILDNANAYDYDRRETEHARDPMAAQRVDYEGKLVPRGEITPAERGAVGSTPRTPGTRPAGTQNPSAHTL
ncbi:general stress protein [Candidatus Laterigemmans baculatus]|uniref:general stress protein n=1 Tax=Candidatus Laterigemmans baculatus TaxID=2770505 RepID=UPI0013DACDE7|nr:general stress protein [Candidatus Laterigemmans baculatus]